MRRCPRAEDRSGAPKPHTQTYTIAGSRVGEQILVEGGRGGGGLLASGSTAKMALPNPSERRVVEPLLQTHWCPVVEPELMARLSLRIVAAEDNVADNLASVEFVSLTSTRQDVRKDGPCNVPLLKVFVILWRCRN